MLRNLSMISVALFASQLLVIVHQSTASLTCKDDKTVLVDKLADKAPFQCLAVPSVDFGEGYEHTEGVGAYKFHKVAQNWTDARKTCISEGAHLAIIDKKDEKEILLAMISQGKGDIVGTNRTDLFWLGGHDHFQEGEFVTVLGDPLSTKFIEFNTASCNNHFGKQPDDGKNQNKGPQNCLALLPGCGTLDDNWCQVKYAFVCEKPESC